MTSNHLMTAGAIGFAGFALWYITRKPGGQLAAQPGQAARDLGLQSWMEQIDRQAAEIQNTSYSLSREQFASLLGRSPR